MPARKTSKVSAKPISRSPELMLIDNLAAILNDTGLSEIELEQKGVRVRVSRSLVTHVQAASASHAAPAPAVAAVSVIVPKAETVNDLSNAVKSPMVGTTYLASSPDSAPFVTVGSTVKQGQTVLIIEAMKTMNQIPAPRAGKVTQILVENGQPVEFGEALLVIE